MHNRGSERICFHYVTSKPPYHRCMMKGGGACTYIKRRSYSNGHRPSVPTRLGWGDKPGFHRPGCWSSPLRMRRQTMRHGLIGRIYLATKRCIFTRRANAPSSVQRGFDHRGSTTAPHAQNTPHTFIVFHLENIWLLRGDEAHFFSCFSGKGSNSWSVGGSSRTHTGGSPKL